MASFGLPPVRVLRPALWCAGAVGTIYVGCAAYEVRHDAAVAREARRARHMPTSPIGLRDLDGVRAMLAASGGRNPLRASHASSSASTTSPSPSPLAAWSNLPEAGKLMVGLVSTNVGVFGLERLLPGTSALFSHVPAASGTTAATANFTMLSSAFGHVGLAHLALNMYGVVQFLPPVAASRTFASSGSHLAAFYLSAGVLASYAYHLAAVWPRPLDRVIPARGASGAVMAVVGAFGMSYPDKQLGIVLIPGSLPASQFLLGVAAFETYGLFVGFKRLPLAHAAHLAGLALGVAYVYYDGRDRVWRPVKQWTFHQMQRLSLV
ncbi:rhomboid-like protein [Sporothrix schenckii 1099-18]|uniref:Rhomboid-like protein n=1 Tax=Sporothrix schenckii 1099-18 TaxID=1397361 RepID=A0A0F2LZS3_SPOSC|nr:rhomboid-like protein [Sporothrix schenckii 1099-18]KJR81995.1 rhomboid-like protein [Sporothrix schenckii 1099-18]